MAATTRGCALVAAAGEDATDAAEARQQQQLQHQVTDALQQQQVDRRDGRLDGAEAAQGARPGRSPADRARAPPGRSRGEWQ